MAKDKELKTPSTVVMAASQRRLKGQGLSKKFSLNSGSSISDLTIDCKAYAAMVRAAAG